MAVEITGISGSSVCANQGWMVQEKNHPVFGICCRLHAQVKCISLNELEDTWEVDVKLFPTIESAALEEIQQDEIVLACPTGAAFGTHQRE